MSENLPNIDNLFRKAMDAHQEAPSGNVWANIDSSLDKKKVFSISQKYRKLKWAVAALLIFSAGMAMYTWSTRIKNNKLVRQHEWNEKEVHRYTPEDGMPVGAGAKVDSQTTGTLAGHKKAEGRIRMVDRAGADKAAATSAVAAILENDKQAGIHKETGTVERPSDRQETDLRGELVAGLKVVADTTGKSSKEAVENEGGMVSENKTFATDLLDKGKIGATSPTIEPRQVLTTVPRNATQITFLPPANVHPESTLPFAIDVHNTGSAAGSLQTSSVKAGFGARISAGVFYSRDFVSLQVDNGRRTFREDDRNEIKDKEKVSNTTAIGLLLQYKLDKRWRLQAGLSFSSITTEIAPKTIFARPDARGNVNYRFNCAAGVSYVTLKSAARPAAGDSIMALSSTNKLHYVGIPITLSYQFLKGRFTLQPVAGLTANFLTGGTLETSLVTGGGNENKSVQPIEGLNTSYINGTVSVAANYLLTRNVGISLTPISRFALGAINRDAPVKTYIHSFGLVVGLNLNL